MTNPVLNNNIATESVILWQYDKAYNLIRLIKGWNSQAKAACTDFWNYFGNNVFPIDRADTFGLNVWGNMLGIPRPTIKIPKSGVNYDGDTNDNTSPSWLTLDATDEEAIDEALASGYVISKTDRGKTYLYKLFVDPVSGVVYDINGYREDGYNVIDDGIVKNPDGTIKEEQDWKTVTIKNTLYRGLLKGRFFMMCHTPTVPNYNKFLSIVFGAQDGDGDGHPDYDIFNDAGEIEAGHSSRNKALDFMDMTMGFTFPKNASTEEAYLIFQHYDTVYPFPAGIRYPGEFILDDLVIGLNTDQSQYAGSDGETPFKVLEINVDDERKEYGDDSTETVASRDNQYYKNFVDGLVLVNDIPAKIARNPNGGIFSTTERANYNLGSSYGGVAYIFDVSNRNTTYTVEITRTGADDNPVKRESIWVDWGDGICNQYYLVPSVATLRLHKKYANTGMFAVIIRHDTAHTVVSTSGYIRQFTLSTTIGED